MRSRRTWIIGYDISSPKRLRRVAKRLEKSAFRIQFSLFIGCWTEAEFERVWSDLARLINSRCDDVRAWPVPEEPVVTTLNLELPRGVVVGEVRSSGFGQVMASRRGGEGSGSREKARGG